MRPDEHKRRKSAQYQNKKKHTASDKHEGKLPVKKDVDENLKRTSTENLNGKKEAADSPDAAKFSRRKLTSNWEKYEIQNEEDPHLGITQKGESFEKLLKSAGASSSQFRFKDETFWEDDVSDLPTTWMTVDVMALADSLDSLTLCQKFGLSKEHFTDDQLKFMKVETEGSKAVSGSSQIKLLNQRENSNSVTPSKTEGNELNQCLTREMITSEQSLDTLASSNNDSPHSCINDQELDSLLSVETVEKSPNLKHSEAVDETADELEDWLDSVLD